MNASLYERLKFNFIRDIAPVVNLISQPSILVDNLKSAVLRRLTGVAPVFNPRYLDFARHHGFTITPCNVARANEKGRVESGVGYVKKNFLMKATAESCCPVPTPAVARLIEFGLSFAAAVNSLMS